MMKKTFEIAEDLKEIKSFIEKAAKAGEVDKDLPFSLIERVTNVLESVLKKIEELEERLDLVEGKF
jgi:hypothetical protein